MKDGKKEDLANRIAMEWPYSKSEVLAVVDWVSKHPSQPPVRIGTELVLKSALESNTSPLDVIQATDK